MPATLKRVRETMKYGPTARDKGLKLTLTVVAYDNGMYEVDGVLMSSEDHPELDAAEVMLITLNEFARKADDRRKKKST